MLAIVASEFDIHADAVMLALRERNFSDILRIDLESSIDRFQISISSSGRRSGFGAQIQGVAASISDVSELATVWWRRSSSQIGVDYLNIPSFEELDRAEMYWATRWLFEGLSPEAFPFGHPFAMRAGENKLRQLQLALTVGFITPKTVVSNDKKKLAEFLDGCTEVVIKPLHTSVAMVNGIEKAEVSLLAKATGSDKLRELFDRIPSTFLFIQEKVDKVYDVRVNVFPNCAVACRIDPAPNSDGVDWRPVTSKCPHSIIDLPPTIEMQCREFLRMKGLKWGAFDFGVSRFDEWVFFECNPNGQWLWIQLHTKHPLAGLVADELLAHHAQRIRDQTTARSRVAH